MNKPDAAERIAERIARSDLSICDVAGIAREEVHADIEPLLKAANALINAYYNGASMPTLHYGGHLDKLGAALAQFQGEPGE